MIITLGNSDANIVIEDDGEFHFSAVPSVPRTYTLIDPNPKLRTRHPFNNAMVRIRVVMTLVSATADAIFEREDATEIGRIVGAGNGGFVEFVWDHANQQWVGSASGGDGEFTNLPH